MAVAEIAASQETKYVRANENYLSNRYFAALDTFRFLSIAAVVWHHTQEGVWWFPASNRGFLGVDFFFLISGFLIVTLLLRERDRTGGVSLRRFYMRRALRIFPIYYLMLGAMTAFFLFVKPHSSMAQPFFHVLPYQVLYLSNFVTDTTILFFTWSLSSEEQFYVFWPPVEKWLRGAVIPVLLGVMIINQLINFDLLRGLLAVDRSRFNILQVTFTPICLGVLVAHVLHDRRGFAQLFRWVGAPWASLVLMSALIVACNTPRGDLSGWPRLVIQLLMALLLVSCVIREDHWLKPLFGVAIVRRIGVVSYGMYLYHEFAAHVVRVLIGSDQTLPRLVTFALTLALTIGIAEVSYRFYETPFLRLKDVLNRRGEQREERETAATRAW